MEYIWFIKIFHKTTAEAYALAVVLLTALQGQRSNIPLLHTDGEVSGTYMKLKDSTLVNGDEGVAQLKISWISRRPYEKSGTSKMGAYGMVLFNNPHEHPK